MNKIIVFIKGLLQLSTILVGIFGLFLFIGGGWLYHDLQYRYVVDSRYNTIFDKANSVYLINKGISMDIINDKISFFKLYITSEIIAGSSSLFSTYFVIYESSSVL